jgi:hypothetical protein
MVAAKAGVTLNLVFHVAGSCHDLAPFKQKKPAGDIPAGFVALSQLV